ncbi:Alpha-taxilin [Golovinomyces cichoracearum]|uniref:Alpha-taxilin n=1 Tax=Golovinomyces cichoracearum TaxID=62708 RepID=A0A420HTS0_9PEZI|nr:Alpha-taxilin [Golovinomyces cichoracearum]
MSTAINSNHSLPSRAPSIPSNHNHPGCAYKNGYHQPEAPTSQTRPTGASKKGKQKKVTDPNEASNLIAAKISQLELDAAGDKEQEAEIEREVKKQTRELNNATAKMDPLQKMETIHRRYTELLSQMKRLERENQKNKKRADMLQKERDHGRSDLSKTTTIKEKLEKLCRELQKDNNRLKAENKTLQDAEKDNHIAWDNKFKQVLWQLEGIQDAKENPQAQVVQVEVDELYAFIAQMTEMKANNFSFRQRFKSLIEQYELRELHFHSLLRTKELEVQVSMGRYDREKKQAEAEVTRSRALNSQVLTFSKTESELRNQLNIYVEKFKQVEDTLNNSNDLFLTFRKEMEEMSKKTKRLEKENTNLTRKHDLTNQNILKMAEERTKANEDLKALQKKNEKLTSIINQMQKQGRGVLSGRTNIAEGSIEGDYIERDLDGTESDYEYEEGEEVDEEEEEEGSEGEYNEDTEEELHLDTSRPFGPVPPPSLPINGASASNNAKQ